MDFDIVRAPLRGLRLLTLGTVLALVPAILSSNPVAAQTAGTGSPTMASPPGQFCGVVTIYNPPTAAAPGTITINGITYNVAPGTTFTGSTPVTNGANVCLAVTFGTGGPISGGTVTANPVGSPSTTAYCGPLTNYVAPTASAAGTVSVGNATLMLPSGAVVTGSNLLTAGSNICLNVTTVTSGAISAATITAQQATGTGSGAGAGAGASGSPTCGAVTAFTPATSTVAGTVTIGGTTYPIAAGTTLGGGTVTVGSNLCLQTVLGAGGAITSGTVFPNASTPLVVCGPVTAFTPATSAAPGSLTVAGVTFPVAPGTTLSGTPVASGSTQVFSLTVGGNGQISMGAVAAGACATPSIQGAATSFTGATSAAAGSFRIGANVFQVSAGSTLTFTGAIPLAASIDSGGGIRVGAMYAD